MIEPAYHRPYCKELLGLPSGPNSAMARPDPEGHFAKAHHHVTDARMDPKVVDESGKHIAFWQIKRGDVVNLRVAVETRWVFRRKIAIHLVLRRVTVLERARLEPTSLPAAPLKTAFAEKHLHVKEDSHL